MLFEFCGSPFWLALSAALAIVLDRCLGEPSRFHPLVGFGNVAKRIEASLNGAGKSDLVVRAKGVVALLLALMVIAVPITAVFLWLQKVSDVAFFVASTLLLYLAIGHQSLRQHARVIDVALKAGDLPEARQKVGYIVSRQTQALDEPGVVKATLESVLENGSDAVFAPLFWFLLAGPIGVLIYRLANTLDAMWGYRNERFLYFGWAAARFDDFLNWLPARLCAAAYVLVQGISVQHVRRCWRLWQQQAPLCESPNAGPVMSAGASALRVRLGGGAYYFDQWHERPVLGDGNTPSSADIERALGLLQRSVWLWLGAGFACAGLVTALQPEMAGALL